LVNGVVTVDSKVVVLTTRFGRIEQMPKYLTTAEVAEALRAPVETVRYWRHVGKGPKSFKAGRRVLYREDDVLAWIESQMDAAGPDAP